MLRREATLVPIRATKSVALVRGVGVAKAVDHARRSGCHIVSMSLGGVMLTGALEAAIQVAVRSGTIVMAAAGNWDWAPFPLPGRAKFVVERPVPELPRGCRVQRRLGAMVRLLARQEGAHQRARGERVGASADGRGQCHP